MLFRDPLFPLAEGVYVGYGLAGGSAYSISYGNDCECITPGCGNVYKCPCYA